MHVHIHICTCTCIKSYLCTSSDAMNTLKTRGAVSRQHTSTTLECLIPYCAINRPAWGSEWENLNFHRVFSDLAAAIWVVSNAKPLQFPPDYDSVSFCHYTFHFYIQPINALFEAYAEMFWFQ